MLARVMARRVDRDDARILCKGGPGSGREVLQARTDGQDHVCGLGHGVGAVRDRFDHWDLMCFGKRVQFGYGAGILNAAACDDHGAFSGFQQRCRVCDLVCIRGDPANSVGLFIKESGREIISPALNVLRQA